jgi:hypothetical protein
LQIDTETSKLVYKFVVKYSGVRDDQSVTLIRVMLLHPYKAFKVEDDFNISAGAEVEIRLHHGMAINLKNF